MSTLSHITTAEQLLRAGDIGRCELISGELHMMTPAGGEHGRVTSNATHLISTHVKRHKLGVLLCAETGFIIERSPDTVRAPDIAFLTANRSHLIKPRGYIEGAPDLAVEVVSFNDTSTEIHAKALHWISCGRRLVWVVDPDARTVTVYTPNAPRRTLTADQILDGGDVLKDFRAAVSEFFSS